MAEGGLTIGKVVARLQQTYPELTVSKVRFLEDEGIVSPSRTTSGYRLFSQKDIRRLETALYLQKNKFLPLSVIKEQLDLAEEQGRAPATVESHDASAAELAVDDDDTLSRLHPIDRMPQLLGVTVSFVRQLAEVGIIELKRSPHGRDLVDGRDFALIRTCDELRHYGFEPKNLRQYVMSANRESASFEQALVVYARKGGGVELERNAETKDRFEAAFDRMLNLTNSLRVNLIKRRVNNPFEGEQDKQDQSW